MARLVLFNKPFNVLSQFTDTGERSVLKDYIPLQGVYPAGRLDRDSEGLLLLTDDGRLQQQISNPRFKQEKTYFAQVEGLITETALEQLRSGVQLKDGMTKPAKAKIIPTPELWQRVPPIRHRLSIPTCWIVLRISEGRNRQVRRMTAAVGYPTLRLVRVAIGKWQLASLQPGEYKVITTK